MLHFVLQGLVQLAVSQPVLDFGTALKAAYSGEELLTSAWPREFLVPALLEGPLNFEMQPLSFDVVRVS
jgi:hypothetical protein